MEIEETIIIDSTIERVWETFTDLSCWIEWNSVMGEVDSAQGRLANGNKIRCSFRPFFFPIGVTVNVEEIISLKRIVWSAKKKGLFAFHEFFFEDLERGVLVTSRERLSGILASASGLVLPARRMRFLTKTFLRDLKRGSER